MSSIRSILKKQHKKPINYTFGVFFDGTLNNMYNSEIRKSVAEKRRLNPKISYEDAKKIKEKKGKKEEAKPVEAVEAKTEVKVEAKADNKPSEKSVEAEKPAEAKKPAKDKLNSVIFFMRFPPVFIHVNYITMLFFCKR